MVCETGSMTETAKKIHMTQPAVSQTILDLEEELNVKLFDRIKNKLVLTNSGKVLLNYSQKILRLVKETEDVIEQITNIKKGELRIGASMTIGTYLLPELIKKFKRIYSGIKLPLVIDNTDFIVDKILGNELDIGLVEGRVDLEDIIIKPFQNDELCLICSRDHHWAEKKIIEPAAIKEADFIIREEGSGTREIIKRTFYKHNLACNIKHVFNNFEAIKNAVAANIGVSIVPEIAVSEEIKRGEIVKVDIKDIQLKRKFNIIYHKDKYHSELFKQFLNYLKD